MVALEQLVDKQVEEMQGQGQILENRKLTLIDMGMETRQRKDLGLGLRQGLEGKAEGTLGEDKARRLRRTKRQGKATEAEGGEVEGREAEGGEAEGREAAGAKVELEERDVLVGLVQMVPKDGGTLKREMESVIVLVKKKIDKR
ncbi:unnamed protein product [Knipowitschia caucasica]|uniref:Uncharacterized protein n=1 Tax=Knipowitschia caucasica TaxID=637954 RepID=A0AAV2M8D1_KNICA